LATTIRDVAREAGVSVASVSKVLHGGGGSIRVGEVRAEHIRLIASKMEYVPNIVARNLRSGKSHTIGLVFENFGSIASGPLYYPYLLDSVASELFKQKYRLTILPEVDTRDASQLGDGRLDGLIWCKLDNDGSVSRLLERSNIPVVALNSPQISEQSRAINFACDNEHGSQLVVDHLIGLGHSRILFLMERGEDTTPDALARLNGFKDAMSDRAFPTSGQDVVYWSPACLEFEDWWATSPEHTAVYAWNEGVAANLLKQAMRIGVTVPDELSVVGFDSTAFCETTTPRLTAVNQPIREMAGQATQLLLHLLAGKPAQKKSYLFPCTLDVRGSTSQPRKLK